MTLPDPALKAAALAMCRERDEEHDAHDAPCNNSRVMVETVLAALGGRVVVEQGCDKHGIFESHSYPGMRCPGGDRIVIWEDSHIWAEEE